MEAIKFTRAITKYGLLENDLVICLLKDDHPTVHEQKSLIHLLGVELVIVHGTATYTELEEISRWPYEEKPVDQNTLNKKDLFAKGQEKVYNPPIEVEFTPNVVLKSEHELNSILFVDKNGTPHDIPDGISSAEKALLANLLKASNVLLKFHVLEEMSNKVSPYRSITT